MFRIVTRLQVKIQYFKAKPGNCKLWYYKNQMFQKKDPKQIIWFNYYWKHKW